MFYPGSDIGRLVGIKRRNKISRKSALIKIFKSIIDCCRLTIMEIVGTTYSIIAINIAVLLNEIPF